MSGLSNIPFWVLPARSRVVFTSDGVEMEGYEGEPIAMALKAAGIEVHPFTAKRHEPRGIFCRIRTLYRLRHGRGTVSPTCAHA